MQIEENACVKSMKNEEWCNENVENWREMQLPRKQIVVIWKKKKKKKPYFIMSSKSP